jgi:hypothetical protein
MLTLKYNKDKLNDLEAKLETCTLENKSLKAQVDALEQKEKQVLKRMEQIMTDKTGVSIMDFKQ